MKPWFVLLTFAGLFVVFSLSASASPAFADLENLGDNYRLGDTRINQASPDSSYGGNDYIQVGDDGGANMQYGCYLFDISNIPPGKVIDNAQLWIQYSAANGSPSSEIYLMNNTTWNENSLTWNNWGSVDGTALDSEVLNATDWENFEVGDGVQAAYDAGENAAFIIQSTELESNKRWIADAQGSSSHAGTSYLEVWYSDAPPSADNTDLKLLSSDTVYGYTMVDRDNDGYLASEEDLQIRLRFVVYDNNGWDNFHTYVSIIDNSCTYVIENENLGTADAMLDENTGRLIYIYSPADNAPISDAALGGWCVELYVVDIVMWEDNLFLCEHENLGHNLFAVTDFGFHGVDVENLAGHKTHWDFNLYTTGFEINGVSQAPEYVTIVDNNIGTYRSPKQPAVGPYAFENTYTNPTAPGEFYAYAYENRIDGVLATQYYEKPDIPPEWLDFAVDNSIIDNHASDNAVTTTYIEAVFIDDDGLADFDNSTFWIALYDNDGNMVENRVVTENTRKENTNKIVGWFVYDAESDELAPEELGYFSVWAHVADNFGLDNTFSDDSDFQVDEYVVPINFTPTNPYAGWDLIVSGTSYRYVGAASVDAHVIIDSVEGTFTEGSGNSYSENYTVTSPPTACVSVTVYAYDGILDGENTRSYTMNENQKFELFVRFEENYELVDWIPDDNRPIVLLFEGSNGSDNYTLTSNPENIIIDLNGGFVENVKITDNDAYWRRNVVQNYGGELVMVIVGEPGTVGGTTLGDVDDFTFFLQDFTGLYEPPDGVITFKLWIGDNQATINKDYWGAEWRSIAWLVTGTRYQLWMEAENAPIRLIGPFDAFNSSEEKTIQVKPTAQTVESLLPGVSWGVERMSDNVIRMEYKDNYEETITARVTLSNYLGEELQTWAPDNEWFIITYSQATPAEGYFVTFEFSHETHGSFTLTSAVSGGAPPEVGGLGNPFGLPSGITLAALGTMIALTVLGLAFDEKTLHIGVLAIVVFTLFAWRMGWITLPGPFDGLFTGTMLLIAAVLVILTRRWRK